MEKTLSDLDSETHKTNKVFQDAVTWSLPSIKGTSPGAEKTERKVNIDDVKQFEQRIKKQIDDIKREKDNPTFLTVEKIEEIQKHAHDEAYEKAYKEAYDKGIKDSEKFLEEQLQAERSQLKENAIQLQQCLNTLSQPLKDIDTDVEQQLTDIVFYFCKNLLGHELSTDHTHILKLIQKSITSLPLAQRNIVVKLNPTDQQLLKEGGVDIAEQDWKVEADEDVAVGGCVINTESSSVDLGIENRIKKLTSQLYSGLKQPDDEALKLGSEDAAVESDFEIKDE